MEYTGKNKKMAEQFLRNGADEYQVEKFIREEMEYDEINKDDESSDIETYK